MNINVKHVIRRIMKPVKTSRNFRVLESLLGGDVVWHSTRLAGVELQRVDPLLVYLNRDLEKFYNLIRKSQSFIDKPKNKEKKSNGSKSSTFKIEN